MIEQFRSGLGRVFFDATISNFFDVPFLVVLVEHVRLQVGPTFRQRFPILREKLMRRRPSRLGDRVRVASVSRRREEESGPAFAKDFGKVHRWDQPSILRTRPACINLD